MKLYTSKIIGFSLFLSLVLFASSILNVKSQSVKDSDQDGVADTIESINKIKVEQAITNDSARIIIKQPNQPDSPQLNLDFDFKIVLLNVSFVYKNVTYHITVSWRVVEFNDTNGNGEFDPTEPIVNTMVPINSGLKGLNTASDGLYSIEFKIENFEFSTGLAFSTEFVKINDRILVPWEIGMIFSQKNISLHSTQSKLAVVASFTAGGTPQLIEKTEQENASIRDKESGLLLGENNAFQLSWRDESVVENQKRNVSVSQILDAGGNNDKEIYLSFASGRNFTFGFSIIPTGVVKYRDDRSEPNSIFDTIDGVSIAIGAGAGILGTSVVNHYLAKEKPKEEKPKELKMPKDQTPKKGHVTLMKQ